MVANRPRYRRLLVPLLALGVFAAAGCQRDSGAGAAPPLPQLERGDGRIEWQGMLACADCDGIETTLSLERNGDARSYKLVETFLAPDGARFVEQGRWQREEGLIRLQGDGGSVRAYGLMPDGSLQPRDTRGRRLIAREGDLLVPVTALDAQ